MTAKKKKVVENIQSLFFGELDPNMFIVAACASRRCKLLPKPGAAHPDVGREGGREGGEWTEDRREG